MDKLNPAITETALTTKATESVSTWYVTENQSGEFSDNELAWLIAQGWRIFLRFTQSGVTTFHLTRRVLRPELILDDLIESYTEAYNEGRELNDQRYDDLVVLLTSVLDKTEDAFNALEADDTTFETAIETIIAALATDHTAYAADVDGDLDTWGTDLLAEINARFDAELAKAQQALVDRGLFSATLSTTMSAGVERERTRALNNANDTIAQRQLELKHRVNSELASMRTRVLSARDRLRSYLRDAKDRQVAVRNQAAEALGRLVERRTDGYPDLNSIGQLAAALGAGNPESFSP